MRLHKFSRRWRLRVFVDDFTAPLKGRKKLLAEMARKVVRKLKRKLAKRAPKLSVTENGKEEEQDDCVMWFPGK